MAYWVVMLSLLANSQNCVKRLLASSYLSARMEQRGSHRTEFHEILYLSVYENLLRKEKFD